MGLTNLTDFVSEVAIGFGIRVLVALLTFFIGTQLIKLVGRILKKSMQRGNADIGAIQFLSSFVKIALYVILIFFIASGFGLDAASVVALLGSAGVAIGLAIQGSLSNFAGGVLILLLKPFKVGDYIITDKGNEGTVIEIQIFYTKLTTADNRVVVIPNGELSNSSMTNVSAMPNRRIDIPVGISYEADIRQAREVITKLLENDDKVLKDHDRRVFVDCLGDSAVMLNVRFYTASEDFWETKWRMTENIKYALDTADIVIPYNQLDVHLDSH
ncbi:MAG: mechanosensitive ion channel [Bacillus sp. (in: Bacteria)]|nr:mechanosensitive ion channel [Bacillus sp. (in: firmicutes)]MCM1426470.1 mechanosensitive ion channel [Eubacterium sp.]